MSSSSPQVVWAQKRKNLKILRGRHTGIVDWHLGIRLGSTSVNVAHTLAYSFSFVHSRYIDVYEQVAWHKSQIVGIAWRLSAIHQIRRTLSPRILSPSWSILSSPCLRSFSPSFPFPHTHLSSAPSILYRSATQKGPVVPGIKRRVWEKRKVFARLSIRCPRFCAHLVNDDPLLYLANVCHSSRST